MLVWIKVCKHKIFESFLSISLIFLLFCPYVFAQAQEPTFEDKRVLFISSYSSSFLAFFEQIDGVNQAFEDYPITLDVEFMDTKRFYNEENIQNFYVSLKYKLDNFPSYDMVMVADDNALDFVMEHQKDMFDGLPIVFLGINDLEKAIKFSEDDLVTGVHEGKSMAETINMAYSLNPKATKVVALLDGSPSSLGDYQLLSDEQNEFSHLTVEMLNSSEMTFDEYRDALSKLGNESIIIYLAVYKDSEGAFIEFDQAIEMVSQSATQPVYVPFSYGIGDGLLGGKVVYYLDQGNAAASMVLDYFNGKPLKDIPILEESPNRYLVDYECLTHFGLSEDELPQDVTFINKQQSFLQKNFLFVLGTTAIILLELLIIFSLIINIKRRRASECELQVNKEKLQITNEELEDAVNELRVINLELETNIKLITEKDNHIEELVYIDNLTGLMNRYAFSEFIKDKLLYKPERFALIFIDMDNFKNINDTFGHDIGDQVVRSCGERLSNLQSDVVKVSRFGGDEFVVIVEYFTDMDKFMALAEQIHNEFNDQIEIEYNRYHLTASFGVAIYPDHGNTIEELMKNADIALYEAKNNGKNQSMIYNDEMKEVFEKKLLLQRQLKKGFVNEEFYLNYQPFISDDGTVEGFEALIRWHDDILGQVSPYRMIREAEEMGLIVEIGEWVFKQACLFLKKINETIDYDLYMSVNVSAVQLMVGDFSDRIKDIAHAVGINPQNICLEMTETILIENLELGRKTVKELRDCGFMVGLDDFGTGYSSLSYLKNLEIDLLKIDKSFVDNIECSSFDRDIIETVVKSARHKQLKVIAEGVEKKAQEEVLKKLGCEVIQGYLYSKPLSAQDAQEYLKIHKRK